jgi:hypothetical protein
MRTTPPQYLPHLRSARGRGLALWVYGTTLAQSACLNAVIAALLAVAAWHDSSAIPVAWHVLPANQPGALMPHILRLLGPAVPPTMQVVVLADQGLSSPRAAAARGPLSPRAQLVAGALAARAPVASVVAGPSILARADATAAHQLSFVSTGGLNVVRSSIPPPVSPMEERRG